MAEIKQNKIINILKLIILFIIICSSIILIPQIRKIIIELAELIIRRELRNHDKWYDFLFFFSIIFIIINSIILIIINFKNNTIMLLQIIYNFISKNAIKNTIINCNKIYLNICIIIIILYTITITITTINIGVLHIGEAGTYTLGLTALQYQRSIFINEETIEISKIRFPSLKSGIEFITLVNHFPRNSVTGERINVSWYFPAYNASCIPMSIFLSIIGRNQSYSFAFTNVLLLFISLISIFIYLKTDEKTKFYIILALIINPINYYISWPSAEVFIYTFIVLTMIFYSNKSYKRAALFLSIAGSMNITAMGLAPFMIISYIIDLHIEKGIKSNIFKTIFNNIKDILKFAFSFSFIILSFIYNYISSAGQSFLTNQFGIAGANQLFFDPLILPRFLAYLFDLNIGLLPWFTFILCIHLILLFLSIIKNNYQYYLPSLGHLLIIFGFSLMTHINSGMTGISRYNSWSAPIIIFIFILGYHEFKPNIQNKLINLIDLVLIYILKLKFKIIIISLSFIFFLLIIINNPYGTTHIHMLPQAKFILNNFPSLYNPLYSTFISRVENRDGGYNYIQPVIYTDIKHNFVRKIMLNIFDSEGIQDLNNMFIFLNLESQLYLKKQLEILHNNNNEFVYINIPFRYFLSRDPFYFENKHNLSKNILIKNNTTANSYIHFPVLLKPNTYYKVYLDIIDLPNNSFYTADFYAPNSFYDLTEAESILYKMPIFLDRPNEYYAYLFSGDITIADGNQIYFRIFNSEGINKNNKTTITNFRLYELLPSNEMPN